MKNDILYEVHGCVEVHSNVERVEDDREAEFFTAYHWDEEGYQLALQDFDTREEAEAWVRKKERGDTLNFHDRRIRWQVRVVREGDQYGRGGQLTHRGETPLVEFWDMDQFKGIGQFVSRYYLDTIQGTPVGQGLSLNLSVHRWHLSTAGMNTVRKFLENKS